MYSVEHHHEGRYAAKVLTLADPFNDSRNKNHPLLCVGQNNHSGFGTVVILTPSL